jgi:hypothetical protein
LQSLLAANSEDVVVVGEGVVDVSVKGFSADVVVVGEGVVDVSVKGFSADVVAVGDGVTSSVFFELGSDIAARAVKLSVVSIANGVVGKYPKKTAIKVMGAKSCAALTLIRAKK